MLLLATLAWSTVVTLELVAANAITAGNVATVTEILGTEEATRQQVERLEQIAGATERGAEATTALAAASRDAADSASTSAAHARDADAAAHDGADAASAAIAPTERAKAAVDASN